MAFLPVVGPVGDGSEVVGRDRGWMPKMTPGWCWS